MIAMPPVEEHVAQKLDISSTHTKLFISIIAVAVLLGVGTGYYLSTQSGNSPTQASTVTVKTPTVTTNAADCKDTAEGLLTKKDAADTSEGEYQLKMSTGTIIALTSSSTDLSNYVNKNVKICGQTQEAIKAKWLIDVVKVEPSK
jgi:hypothetical protein